MPSTPFALPSISLQDGWTATLKAAYKGHLAVLQMLVEEYGGNVLHRKKVRQTTHYFSHYFLPLVHAYVDEQGLSFCGATGHSIRTKIVTGRLGPKGLHQL